MAEEGRSGSYSITKTITVIVMIFTFLLIMSLVLLYLSGTKEKSLQGAEQQIKLSSQGGFNCEYSEAQKLYPFGEGVMKVTNERIAYLTLSGNEIYSVGVNYKNPSCITYRDTCLVYDLDGYSFCVLNKENLVYTSPTSNQIKGASLSQSGYASIITADEKSYGDVFIFDEAGNLLSQWSSNVSGYPLAVAFNADTTKACVTTVNTTGAVAVPYIRIFDIVKTQRGVTVEENSFYTTDSNDILANCFYLNKNLYAFSSTKLYKMAEDKITSLDLDFSVANYAMLVGDHIFLVFSDGVDQMNKLAIIDHNDHIGYSSDIGTQVHCVCASKDLFAISVDNRIFVYNESGVVVGDISVDEDILRMGFISGKDLCVVSTGGVHTVNY